MALSLLDLTSNHNDLTNVNGVTASSTLPFATNNVNAAALALASSQYLSATDSTSLSVTNNFTLECWVNFASLPAVTTLDFLSKYDGAGKASFLFRFNTASNQLRLFTSSDGTTLLTTSVSWSPSTSTYYHLAITFASGTVKYYVNGSQQGTDQTDLNTSIFDSTAPFVIGADTVPSSPSNFFDGLIDDVRVYNAVRSQADIASDYQQELIGNETNLVAYWPFEQPNNSGFFFMM